MAFQPENMPELKIFFLNIKSSGEGNDDKIIQLSFNYGVYNKENNKFSELETFNNYVNIRGNLPDYATQKYGITKEDIEKSEYLENFIFKILFYISQADVILGFDTEKQVSQLNNEISTLNIGYKLGDNVSDIKTIASNELNKEINSIEELYSSLFGAGYAIGYGEAPLLSKCFFKLFDTSDKVYEVLSSTGEEVKPVEENKISPILQNSIYSGLIDKWKDNEEAIHFLTLVAEGKKSIFLTGKAGSGKSTLIKDIIKAAEDKLKIPIILGSTGMAAMNIGGKTVHSFYGLGISTIYYEDLLKYIQGHKKRRHYVLSKAKLTQLKEAPFVIIDEVSMLRSDIVDCVNVLMSNELQNNGYDTNGLSFGGKQVIFVGDVHQLPPVKRAERIMEFKDKYDSEWFFDSHTFKNQLNIPQLFLENNFDYRILELKKNYRQKNSSEFLKILDNIRECTVTDEDIENLNDRVSKVIDTDSIFLASKVDIARRINEDRLASLPGKEYVFQGKVTDKFPNELKRAGDELRLKIGARVMFLVNESIDKPRYVNGSIGVLKDVIENGDKTKLVVTLDGNDYEIGKNTWLNTEWVKEDGKWVERARGKFTQFPFQLAYAITIHKSQGLTLDKAQIDSVNLFTGGQGYVALSRVKSITGLKLVGKIHKEDLYFSDEVFHFKDFMSRKIDEDKEIDEATFDGKTVELPIIKTVDEISTDETEGGIFYFKRSNINARGRFVDNIVDKKGEFIILKGSIGTAELTNSFLADNKLFTILKTCLEEGKAVKIGKTIKYVEDLTVYSPTEAANILTGAKSGKSAWWVDKDGNILDDLIGTDLTIEANKPIASEITTLSVEQAIYFSNLKVDELCFSNLFHLNIKTAQIISGFEGKILRFPKVSKMSGNETLYLSRFGGDELDLSGLTGIDDFNAKYLCEFGGATLNLSGVKNLSYRQIELLSTFKGVTLDLSGLDSILDSGRELLEENITNVILPDSVKDESDSNEEENEEDLYQFAEDGVLAVNIEHLTDNYLWQLYHYDGDRIDITIKDGLINAEQCKKLATYFNGKELCIEGINISWKEAAELAKFKGNLLEVGICGGSLRYDTLRELVKFKGDHFILSGFDELQEGQEEILVSFKGTQLGVFGTLTDEQKVFFDRYEGVTIGEKKNLDDEDEEEEEVDEDVEEQIEEEEIEDETTEDADTIEKEETEDETNYDTEGDVSVESKNGSLTVTGDHVTDDQMRQYISFSGNTLVLNLRHLSDKQAELLSIFAGSKIMLYGIESITDEQAQSLSKFKGSYLQLSDLKFLDNEQANYLSQFKGTTLDLGGLIMLNEVQSEYLSQFNGDSLYLWRVPFLNDKEIESLSKFKGSDLYLGGISELTDEQAKFLGWYKGDSLDLSGITKLSDQQSIYLSEFRGSTLDLSGLKKITKKQLSHFNRLKDKGHLRLPKDLIHE